MSKTASATFAITGWDENTWEGKPNAEVEGEKRTHAIVNKSFEGDLTGTGTLHYLMAYHAPHDAGNTHFIGLEHITGTLAGKSGSFVLQHTGIDNGTQVEITWTVVPGSGTDELAGLTGQGTGVLVHRERYPFVLEYDFE